MTKTPDKTDVNSRRAFLKKGAVAAAAGAAGLAMPNVARAQDAVNFKFQSTWPAKDIFHEFAADFVARVNEMAGGKLKIELLAAGSVAKAFEVQDAVIAGTLDGGHGVTAYWYGKHKAFSLFGTPPAWGWRANQMLGWVKYGGGQALYDELVQQILGLNLVGFLTGPMPTQPLGWFKKEVTSAGDLNGVKYRTVGLSADLFKEMGAAVTIMGGGEIVPAMDRGLLDAAEFNNPSSDKLLGFADVSKDYMLQSYHQSAESFEIVFNKAKFDALAPELQAIIKYASEASSADMSWKAMDRYSTDLAALKEAGVKVHKTPDSVLQAQLAAWDKVLAAQSAEPFFAKVLESQKAWVKRVVGAEFELEVEQNMAFDHFFKA
ncbi:MAG: TRAP transporter substrate-binding protein [Hyphomicrobiales bacterium]|jgi:TRAP-type mannitol/chloroaromatic compound transport system substrate-binding protein|nr:TRAP transporter substrate-binding protein [Hyphomicrobiales bacterium]HRA93834.1 TRAP transporter substrate-binding protein [Aestuariivirga sp.]